MKHLPSDCATVTLERLSVTILVKELNIRGLESRERIRRLLEQAGITKSQVYVV